VSTDVAELFVEGPWTHRFVAANGARFHVVEAGTGPLVVLLHGFPQFWWAWRHQVPRLAEAGYRAVAMDLRGYAGSDKPPRGYDTATSSADVAGVVRALGEPGALVVGHDWGGWIAWSMPGYAPRLTRAVAVLAMAHPLDVRTAALRPLPSRRPPGIVREWLSAQAPVLPERRLADGREVSRVLRSGRGAGYPDAEAENMYSAAMRVPFAAHSSVEYLRWAVRSVPRRDGRRFAAAVSAGVTCPVLTICGADDGLVPEQLVRASHVRVRAPVEHHVVPGVGHFLPEEAPDAVTKHLLEWLATIG
jgi:pimeloyl-ACP methyl ester carboxylesterase